MQGIILNLQNNFWRVDAAHAEGEDVNSPIEGMSMREKLELIRKTAGVSEDGSREKAD